MVKVLKGIYSLPVREHCRDAGSLFGDAAAIDVRRRPFDSVRVAFSSPERGVEKFARIPIVFLSKKTLDYFFETAMTLRPCGPRLQPQC